jgi:hypothetical protein
MTASAHDAVNLPPGEARELVGRPDADELGVRVPAGDRVAEGIARCDRMIGDALRDRPAPWNLRVRLLARMDAVDAERRRRKRLRSFAVALTSLAAGVLLVAWLKPFGPLPFDGETVAARAADVYELVLSDPAALAPGLGATPWPTAIPPETRVGRREVAFLGRRVDAYALAADHARGVLLVVPAAKFPYQLDRQRIVVPQSTRRLQVHCFASGRQICVLIVPADVDPKRFETPRALT